VRSLVNRPTAASLAQMPTCSRMEQLHNAGTHPPVPSDMPHDALPRESGVIALLISILLPALGKAREAGWRFQCHGKVNQLGIASTDYAAESNDSRPIL